jgi:hypothetical protein
MTDLEQQNTKLGDLNYYFAYNAAPIQNNKQVSNTCKYYEFNACLLGKKCDSILVYLLGSLERHACKYLILACLLRSVLVGMVGCWKAELGGTIGSGTHCIE